MKIALPILVNLILISVSVFASQEEEKHLFILIGQ